MPENTPNLNLYKVDPATDGNDTFNIDTMLNENWDKIDQHAGDTVKHVTAAERSGWNSKETTAGAQAKADAAAAASVPLIDYVRSPGFGLDSGTANAKAITLNPPATSYEVGMGFAFLNNVENSGPVTINVDGIDDAYLRDSKGNNLTAGKLKADCVYSVRYNGEVFILQGEGGEYGTAGAEQVVAGYTVGTEAGIVSGAIKDYRAKNFPGYAAVNTAPGVMLVAPNIATGSQVVNAATGLITDMSSYIDSAKILSGKEILQIQGSATSDATAAASDILSGKTAYVNGVKLTGSRPKMSWYLYDASLPDIAPGATYLVNLTNTFKQVYFIAICQGQNATGANELYCALAFPGVGKAGARANDSSSSLKISSYMSDYTGTPGVHQVNANLNNTSGSWTATDLYIYVMGELL
ncbi:hypothetical protein D3C75_332170 [compost metagenome]